MFSGVSWPCRISQGLILNSKPLLADLPGWPGTIRGGLLNCHLAFNQQMSYQHVNMAWLYRAA